VEAPDDEPVVRIESLPEGDTVVGDMLNGHFRWDATRDVLGLDRGGGIRARFAERNGRVRLALTDPFHQRARDRDLLLRSVVQYGLVANGAVMLHAAALRRPDGGGVVLAGPAGTGKTVTAALLTRDHGFDLLGGEWVVLRDGRVHGVPDPLEFRPDAPIDLGELADSSSLATRLVRRIRAEVGVHGPPWLRRILRRTHDRLPVPDRLFPDRGVIDGEQFGRYASSAPLDDWVFLDCPGGRDERVRRLTARRGGDRAVALFGMYARKMTRHRFVDTYRYLVDDGIDLPARRNALIRRAIESAECHAAETPKRSYVQTVLDIST
jgi:hypothetical protein